MTRKEFFENHVYTRRAILVILTIIIIPLPLIVGAIFDLAAEIGEGFGRFWYQAKIDSKKFKATFKEGWER